MDKEIKKKIATHFGTELLSCDLVSKSFNGSVYKVALGTEPFSVAVKVSKDWRLMEKELKMLDFISQRVDIRLPKVYFSEIKEGLGFYAMEFFEGISAGNKAFLKKSRAEKERFAEQAIDNLIKLQSVKNDKFGGIDDAKYDCWTDYYKPFAKSVLDFALEKAKEGAFPKKTCEIMAEAYGFFDRIFDESVGDAVLTHGDYWISNLIVAEKDMTLVGVVDPFNVMWADREYELLALPAGNGKKFKLLETYKAKVPTTEKCDLKVRFYVMFSETFWYKSTGNYYSKLLKGLGRDLKKQMKIFSLKK